VAKFLQVGESTYNFIREAWVFGGSFSVSLSEKPGYSGDVLSEKPGYSGEVSRLIYPGKWQSLGCIIPGRSTLVLPKF